MIPRFEDDDWLYNPNLYGNTGCILQADGIGFEPEAFLRDTTFDAKLILFHGKIGFPDEFKLKVAGVEPAGTALFETTFLLIEVSKAETHAVQIAEASAFFDKYGAEVQRLQSFPQVENITLRFMTEEAESSRRSLPHEFMGMAMNRGVTAIMF
jgi:hypothetical protein